MTARRRGGKGGESRAAGERRCRQRTGLTMRAVVTGFGSENGLCGDEIKATRLKDKDEAEMLKRL